MHRGKRFPLAVVELLSCQEKPPHSTPIQLDIHTLSMWEVLKNSIEINRLKNDFESNDRKIEVINNYPCHLCLLPDLRHLYQLDYHSLR